jgi:hypothetical protein
MTSILRTRLSQDEIAAIEQTLAADFDAGRADAMGKAVKKLRRYQSRQQEVALALIRVVANAYLSIEQSLEVLREIYSSHSHDLTLVGRVGDALDQARDIDLLNAPPPTDTLFFEVINALSAQCDTTRAQPSERFVMKGLATAARMTGRQHDELAERAYRRLIELEPDVDTHHYNFGLFLKTRGRFQEGSLANQTARRLSQEPSEACNWNLGICATGARESSVALSIWKELGSKIELGRFDLPEGGYAQVKVRLAQRPLAERDKDSDDPGLEETIWIQRLSPCHGVIRSVLYQDLGVDYGDVILFDGAPITYHTYGERQIPVFPHLATLICQRYRFFDFAGTQAEQGQIGDLSRDLHQDAIVYPHSENFQLLCATCWRDPSINHGDHITEKKNVVTGRIAAPPGLEPKELLQQLDGAIAQRDTCRLYSPELCEAAGLMERADVERRRFDMIKRS